MEHTEHVLILPPKLTQSAYQTLIACHAVPRPWHLEGRFGSRTHKLKVRRVRRMRRIRNESDKADGADEADEAEAVGGEVQGAGGVEGMEGLEVMEGVEGVEEIEVLGVAEDSKKSKKRKLARDDGAGSGDGADADDSKSGSGKFVKDGKESTRDASNAADTADTATGCEIVTIVTIVTAIPVLYNAQQLQSLSLHHPQLKELLDTPEVNVVRRPFHTTARMKAMMEKEWENVDAVGAVDATMHPELEPAGFEPPYVAPRNTLDLACNKSISRQSHESQESPKSPKAPKAPKAHAFNYAELFDTIKLQKSLKMHTFTYAELFGGIGGFGVALDALGGKCVFYSEIDERCRATYKYNFDTEDDAIWGDIYSVPNEVFRSLHHINHLDLLVAGFPCQPFSTLGTQPGLSCPKGRGHLYLQIVRALELAQPKAFLLENVPGLLGMKEFDVIMDSFRAAGAAGGGGYRVKAEVYSSRGLTATNRKRLFFVGVRNDLVDHPLDQLDHTNFFQFPFVPDLNIRSDAVLDYDSLPQSELELLRLSESTWDQLVNGKGGKSGKREEIGREENGGKRDGKGGNGDSGGKNGGKNGSKNGGKNEGKKGGKSGVKWRPHHLAWPNRHCDTLTSHYGNAVGRGDSQLVPCSAIPNSLMSSNPPNSLNSPNSLHSFDSFQASNHSSTLPRRFSVRECARLMGFPNSFQFPERQNRQSCEQSGQNEQSEQSGQNVQSEQSEQSGQNEKRRQSEMAHRKEGYRMLGNAVCPPLIAALAGSVLDAAGVPFPDTNESRDVNEVQAGKEEKEETEEKKWVAFGRHVAVELACAALRPNEMTLPLGSLVRTKRYDFIVD